MVQAATWKIARGDLIGGSRARRQFAEHLRTYAMDPVKQSAAELVFGELIANALVWSRTMVFVELYEDPRVLRVMDDGDCFNPDTIPVATAQSEKGRGIHIVRALAAGFIVELREAQCCVTVLLR